MNNTIIGGDGQFEKLCLESFQSGLSWRYEPDAKQLAVPQTATTSVESIALSKGLKKLGWKFIGPTTAYAFMQSMGLINDHVEGCVTRTKVEHARNNFILPD